MENQTEQTSAKHWAVVGLFVSFALIVFGLLWFLFLSPSNPEGFGWFLFSFAAGLSMIVLPCTLPLAFVIVPLSMGKGVTKGLGIAVSFGLGIAITLSLYGVLAAIVGQFTIGSLGAPLEVVKNWVYFIAGIFALLFALGEIGLLKFRMPTYTGAAPAFIQRRQDLVKAFCLGLFLGNIGVGCPHPATPLILIEIATSGNVLYGWLLFFVHALGRILPLLFLAVLGILGVNGLSWLVARREKVEKATGWAMIFVAGFILTLGLFSHAWWVNSGIHTGLEKITQEETILNIVRENLNSAVIHSHGLEVGTGLFGLPLWLGNWFLVSLWIIPIWWWWFRKKQNVQLIPETNTVPEKNASMQNLNIQKYLFVVLSILLVLIFIYTLPRNFANSQNDHMNTPMMEMGNEGMMDHNSEIMEGMNHEANLHEESEVQTGLVVNFLPEKKILVGASTTLQFFANILPLKTPVLNLEIEHTKYIHVIGVRDDLTNFSHIHPSDLGGGKWGVDFKFKEAGNYKVWSDVTYQGETHSFGHSKFEVISNQKETAPSSPRYLEFFKNVVVDKYQVTVEYPEPIVINRETQIEFDIKDFTGNGIEIEPYLGADMHLAVIKDDLSEYVHTHPSDHEMAPTDNAAPIHENSDGHHGLINNLLIREASANGTAPEDVLPVAYISFDVSLSKPGVYKMFAQFRPKGTDLPPDQSLVAEFYIKVLESGPEYPVIVEQVANTSEPRKVPGRISLFVVSSILIVLLGYGSYKFINIKS